MASAATLDGALLAVAAAAREQEKEARRERARVIDDILDLLVERAEARQCLKQSLWYLPDCPTRDRVVLLLEKP
jgi:hypothetical protein